MLVNLKSNIPKQDMLMFSKAESSTKMIKVNEVMSFLEFLTKVPVSYYMRKNKDSFQIRSKTKHSLLMHSKNYQTRLYTKEGRFLNKINTNI